jgi:hypothetical protein
MATLLDAGSIQRAGRSGYRENTVLEDIKYTLQCHPIAGWLFVGFTAITLAATAITQIGGALKVLGIIK